MNSCMYVKSSFVEDAKHLAPIYENGCSNLHSQWEQRSDRIIVARLSFP